MHVAEPASVAGGRSPTRGGPVRIHLVATSYIDLPRTSWDGRGHGKDYRRSPGDLIGTCWDDRHRRPIATVPAPGRRVTCDACLAMALVKRITWPGWDA
jgi:hypothetical protein